MDFPTAITLSPEKAAQNIRMLPCWLMWPINKILYADIRVKGIISSLWTSFFFYNQRVFLLGSCQLQSISFCWQHASCGSFKEERKNIACHSYWLAETTARWKKICPAKSKEWIWELYAKSLLYFQLPQLITACAGGVTALCHSEVYLASTFKWKLLNVPIRYILLWHRGCPNGQTADCQPTGQHTMLAAMWSIIEIVATVHLCLLWQWKRRNITSRSRDVIVSLS